MIKKFKEFGVSSPEWISLKDIQKTFNSTRAYNSLKDLNKSFLSTFKARESAKDSFLMPWDGLPAQEQDVLRSKILKLSSVI